MKAKGIKFNTVDEYIRSFPSETMTLLEELRQTIKIAAPKAEEMISYNMPAIKLNKMLVYYAAFENHIGFYPTASGIAHFQKQLSEYKSSKGAVQFPIDKPLPLGLVTKIVKFRLKENMDRNG